MQKLNPNLTRRISFLSTTLALTPLVAFLTLILPPTLSPDITSATSSSSGLNIGISEVLSLSIEAYDETTSSYTNNSNLSMSIIPGTFKTASARITADTNAPYGYHLVLSNNDSNNALVEQNDDPTTPTSPVISSITTNTTIADTTDSTKLFPDNTWGYNLTDISSSSNATSNTTPPTIPLTYSKIPTNSTSSTIANTTNLGSSTYTFTTGTRVDKVLPAGIYKDELVFSIIANAAPLAPSFYTTYYMQDFNQTACNSVKTPTSDIKEVTDKYGSNYHDNGTNATIVPSTTLIDKRDNQEYIIRKLADGNCWMTENLRYGINPDNSGHPWAADDTDLTASGVNATMMANLTYDSANPNTAGRIKNGSSGMKTADNSQDAFSANGDNYTEPYINVYQANDVANYDGQTKYGVQYNYCAATGGTACTPSETIPAVSGSICPAGWTLPSYASRSSGTSSNSDIDKSWQKLLNNYGIADYANLLTILADSPLLFVRAGANSNNSLRYRSPSGVGFYWSSTTYSATGVHVLRLTNANVHCDGFSRFAGFNVRCVLAS